MKLNRKKNAGFTLLEIMVVIVILGVLVSVMWPKLARGNDAKNAKIIVDDIGALNVAAKSWKGPKPNYTGISMSALATAELIDADWSSGANINPVNGNYGVSANAANLVITATALSTGLCDTVKRRIESSDVQAICSADTLTVTVR